MAGPSCGPVRWIHPEVGAIELFCRRLIDPDQARQLVVHTAAPGAESADKLELLSVLGARRL